MKAASFAPVGGVLALTAFLFGGYLLHGGRMEVIVEGLPGVAVMVVLCALAATGIRAAAGAGIFASAASALRGRRFRTEDYGALKTVLRDVLSGRADDVTARMHPILSNADIAGLVSDARDLSHGGTIGADDLGIILQSRNEGLVTAQRSSVQTLNRLGQSLLWFGVLAVILGLVHIMISVTEPPEVLGEMVGSAMVSILLAVFLAAGLVYPLAWRLEAAIADDARVYRAIRTAFVCRAAGSNPEVAVQTAFGSLDGSKGAESGTPKEGGSAMKWAVLFVVVVAAGLATAYLVNMRSEHAAAGGIATASGPVFYELPQFNVNTATPGVYVKLKLTLDILGEDAVAPIEEVSPRIVDVYQGYLRGLTRDDLEGETGSAAVKAELLKRINELLPPGTVKGVLIKEMLVSDQP